MNNLMNNGAKTAQKILVLGATGGTGRLIVGRALEHGQEVTALVLREANVGLARRPNLAH
jgi:uncharacterized protein YbjT (DUF2867 family)